MSGMIWSFWGTLSGPREEKRMAHAHVSSGGRYPVLRAVAILFMVNAIVVIGVGIYWAYYMLAGSDQWLQALASGDRARLAVAVVLATFFGVLTTIGIAEMIKLAMDVEHNTRSAAQSAAEGASGKKWIDGEETAEGALLRGR